MFLTTSTALGLYLINGLSVLCVVAVSLLILIQLFLCFSVIRTDKRDKSICGSLSNSKDCRVIIDFLQHIQRVLSGKFLQNGR